MRTHALWLVVAVVVATVGFWVGDAGACQRTRLPTALQDLDLIDAQGAFVRQIGDYDVFVIDAGGEQKLYMLNVKVPGLYFIAPWTITDPNSYELSLGPWFLCTPKNMGLLTAAEARDPDPNRGGETIIDSDADGHWDWLLGTDGRRWKRAGDTWQLVQPTTAATASSQPTTDADAGRSEAEPATETGAATNADTPPAFETETFAWRGDRTYTIGYTNDMYGGVSRAFVRCDGEVVWATEGIRFSVREIGDPNASDPRVWDTEAAGPIVVFFDWNLSGKGGGLLHVVGLGAPVATLDVVDVPYGGEIRDVDDDGMFEIVTTDEAYLFFGGGSRADSPHPRVVLRYHRWRFVPWLPEANARTVLQRANEAMAGVSADALYQLAPTLVSDIVDQIYAGRLAAARAMFDAQANLPADVRTACWLELLGHLPASNYGPDVLAWNLAAYAAAHTAPVLLPTEPQE